MKLSMNWLSDYVKANDIDIKEYCDRMTDTGSKVEGYELIGHEVTNVLVGKILATSKHPDADRLTVCSVDVGGEAPIQIITAATNVFEGALVPVACDNSTLVGGVKIKKGKLRGLPSEGMFCSIAELGLTLHDMPGAIEDGILILGDVGHADAKPGTPINDVLMLNDEVVEFEITPNRPDCLSVIGLARESAVTFDRTLTVNEPKVTAANDGDNIANYLKVDIANAELCPRYSAAVVKNIKIAPSPLWLRMRLRASGVRPINNIVDITNYVMLEYGQPMHAFDYSSLDGNHIIVRNATDGEAFKSLDDKDHTLAASMLVIADEKKACALAGVMGGANSEIVDTTKTVVFESANFKGANIRITAKKLGMRTESSARFEKGMDAENTIPALNRALELITLLGAGDVVNGMIDVYPGKKDATVLPLDAGRINRFLGMNISEDFMKGTLKKLDFTETADGKFVVPSFRADVECMNDIAEEVIRIYGYNKLENTLPSAGAIQGGRNPHQAYEVLVSDALAGFGFDEIHTFSFISPKFYDMIRMPEDDIRRKSVVITNPLGEDTSVMRTTTLPSMLNVLADNYNHKNLSVAMYEIGKVYLPTEEDKLPDEPGRITLGFFTDGVKDAGGFYRMKGYIEELLAISGIDGVDFVSHSASGAYHPGRCAKIMLGDVCLGIMGEIHPLTAENYGFGCPVYTAELDFEAMFDARKTVVTYAPIPKHPALERDFSFVCDEALEAGVIAKAMKRAGGNTVKSVELFDIYRGAQLGEGKKSLSYAVKLLAQDHTLTDEEADGTVKRMLKKLEAEFGITLRS